jgi:hypothetical protein
MNILHLNLTWRFALARIDGRAQLGDRHSGLGLTCALGGVTLAGVPLLRRTMAGLEPRPIAELAVLMKSAYGYDVYPAQPYPALDVIARALNQGDIGRAMVAAVQLRLPDLDEAGAAYIVRANETLKKYDSSEPRDERGRWTNGGGSPPNSPAKPAAQVQPAKPVKSLKPIKPARRRLNHLPARTKPILVSDSGGFEGLPPLESLAVILGLSNACVNHAQAPRYYEKTQACSNVGKQCEWLARKNAQSPLRRDACLWPDGSAAIMKLGVMVPFKMGHRF